MKTADRSCRDRRRPARFRPRGFSLVELMVAMAVGLLATLAITSVTLVNEEHKRNTASGSDAQTNGAMALFTLQRDVQMGGYGLTSIPDIGGCEIKGKNGSADFTWRLAPVVITNGVDGAPDTIEISNSTHREFSVPMETSEDHTRGGNEFVIKDNTNVGNAVGDLVVVIPKAPSATDWCSLFTISEAPTGNTLRHATGSDFPWNQPAPTSVFPGATDTAVAYPAKSLLVNLGRLVNRIYSLSNTNTLQVQAFSSDALTISTEDLLPNIVSLQAVYGKDTVGNDRSADVWNTVTPTSAGDWQQVVALRIAVVARSTQRDKEEVTTAAPQWRPDGVTAEDISVGAAGDAEWKHYRYHVFETTVAMRNMIWQAR
jgi:type IV pilus assembly protein PilW